MAIFSHPVNINKVEKIIYIYQSLRNTATANAGPQQ